MWILRAIRLGIARVLRLIAVGVIGGSGAILCILAFGIVVLEGSNEV